MALFLVYNFEYTTLSANIAIPLIFDEFNQFAHHFNYHNFKCLTNLNMSSKSESDYSSSNGDNFSELDCVYTTTFHWEGGR